MMTQRFLLLLVARPSVDAADNLLLSSSYQILLVLSAQSS